MEGLNSSWTQSVLNAGGRRSTPIGIEDSLRRLDEETTGKWKYRVKPQVETAHSDAVALMKASGKKQLTPNEIKQDAARYAEAIKSADAEASMADLSAHNLNQERFVPLDKYLQDLHNKLADYPENPTPLQ